MTNPTHTDDSTALERAMPSPDYILTEQITVPVPAAQAFHAVSTFDLTDIRQPAVRALLWTRELPRRLRRRVPPRRPTRFTLDDLAQDGDWVLLDRRPDRDVALGAVGRFWTPMVRWRQLTPQEFADFAEPRWGKVAMGFSVLPYGSHRSIVAHEVRITFYDNKTRKMFERYWWTVRPFVQLVLRDMLRTIRNTAVSAALSPPDGGPRAPMGGAAPHQADG